MKLLLLFLMTLTVFQFSFAQNKENLSPKLPAKVKQLLGNVKLIETSNFIPGFISNRPNLNEIKDTFLLFNTNRNTKKQTSNRFYLGVTEVTNEEYSQFINWVRDSIAHSILGHYKYLGDKKYIDWTKKINWEEANGIDQMYNNTDNHLTKRILDTRKLVYSSGKFNNNPLNIYPDTLCWYKDYGTSLNESFTRNYLNDSKYRNYPVVGISWEQANAYCDWKSNEVNKQLHKLGYDEIDVRLPTEIEWEQAVLKSNADNWLSESYNRVDFPWTQDANCFLVDKKGNYLVNFGVINSENSIRIKDFSEDGYMYTCNVKAFPSYNGLYGMAGNVDEWVSDKAKSNYSNHTFYIDNLQDTNFVKRVNKRVGIKIEPNQLITFIDSTFNSSNKDEIVNLAVILLEEGYGDRLDDELLNYKIELIKREFKILNSGNKAFAKGGSWYSSLFDLSSGTRRAYSTSRGYSFVGFRIAFSPLQKKK